ncbi:MAG: hypothetical protein WA194_05480 [Patescibacteria group bacterium]
MTGSVGGRSNSSRYPENSTTRGTGISRAPVATTSDPVAETEPVDETEPEEVSRAFSITAKSSGI